MNQNEENVSTLKLYVRDYYFQNSSRFELFLFVSFTFFNEVNGKIFNSWIFNSFLIFSRCDAEGQSPVLSLKVNFDSFSWLLPNSMKVCLGLSKS